MLHVRRWLARGSRSALLLIVLALDGGRGRLRPRHRAAATSPRRSSCRAVRRGDGELGAYRRWGSRGSPIVLVGGVRGWRPGSRTASGRCSRGVTASSRSTCRRSGQRAPGAVHRVEPGRARYAAFDRRLGIVRPRGRRALVMRRRGRCRALAPARGAAASSCSSGDALGERRRAARSSRPARRALVHRGRTCSDRFGLVVRRAFALRVSARTRRVPSDAELELQRRSGSTGRRRSRCDARAGRRLARDLYPASPWGGSKQGLRSVHATRSRPPRSRSASHDTRFVLVPRAGPALDAATRGRRRRRSGAPPRHRLARGAARLGLPARDGARARAAVHVRRPEEASARARSCRCRSGAARGAASSSALDEAGAGRSRRSPVDGSSRACRRRSSTSRSGSPTTTARRRPRARARRARTTPKRRGERPPPAERQSLGGEARAGGAVGAAGAAASRGSSPRSTRAAAHFLLHGATGSGKTEVYLQACAAALARGLGAIVLVPEIALAPQTVGRFRARFGDRVAILHSGLTDAERRDERERIARGEARVVVGARSAVFAPVRDLGLICVDEEHDAVLQAGVRPALRRANGRREAGGARGRGRGLRQRDAAPGELGEARAARARRPARRAAAAGAGRRPAPRGGLPALGAAARGARRASPSDGGKAILLLNRRGVAPALHCRACGATRRCPNCDVALVLHRDGSLRCHHCGHAEPPPETCPACGSAELARLGAGTQRLERELATRAPRSSSGSASTRTPPRSRARSPTRCAASPPTDRAVLLGTQMVAKGHHFAGRRARRGRRRRHRPRACRTSAPRSARSSS